MLKYKAAGPLTDAHIYLPLDGSFMQWGVVPVVSGIGICTLTQEEADHLCVPEGAGIV